MLLQFFQKSMLLVTSMLILLAVFLFNIYDLTQLVISYFLGYGFSYVESPFLPFFHILIVFVSFVVIRFIYAQSDISAQRISLNFLLILYAGLVFGYCLHIYLAVSHMNQLGSLARFEESYFYYSTEIGLTLGFIFAALVIRSKIHVDEKN